MSSDSIEDEERTANDRLHEQLAETIEGKISALSGVGDKLVTVGRQATVAETVAAMIENRVGAIVIVEDQKLYGLFTERDLVTRVVSQNKNPSETSIADVMTSSPECLSFDDDIVFALNRMTVGGYRHIPILDSDGAPEAIVSMRDVVEHIVSFYSTEVFNLPERPSDNVTSDREGA